MLPLAAALMGPPELDWSEKKKAVRDQMARMVEAGNAIYGREDSQPDLVMERLPGYHGKFNHGMDRMRLDLESVQDDEKFWHVHDETIPHELAHRLQKALYDRTGHTDDHKAITEALMQWRPTGQQSR